MSRLPVSPLSLNQLTRDYWGSYDAKMISQLAGLANDPCYQQKFYKAPADDQELLSGYGFTTYGLRITPGSVIFGFYFPRFPSFVNYWTVQITDVSLGHTFTDEPVSCTLLSNNKPTFMGNGYDYSIPATPFIITGSFPNLLAAPHPVVGSGLFDVKIQNTHGSTQRVQLVIGVLEVCNVG
jgi:hypothetical protein